MTAPLTGRGEILGTLNYMSPEQLEGKEADARSDIFSFGLVLYEMLTGARAFEGSSPASLIAAILKEEPRPVASLQPLIPPALERTIRKCLTKEPDLRWQSVRDLRHELEWIVGGGATAPIAVARGTWRERAAWTVAAIFLGASLFLATRSSPRPSGELMRFTIYPPENTILSGSSSGSVATPQFSLSPDGRAIVFVATTKGARPMLWLRTLDEIAARPLPGTENAENPFWSPDSRWVAFFSEATLKKIPISGGPAQALIEGYTETRGGSWSPDGTIVFATGNSDMYRVPSSGGAVTTAMKVDTSQQEATIRWPYSLPDGRHFVFNIRGGSPEHAGIYAASLDGKRRDFSPASIPTPFMRLRATCCFWMATRCSDRHLMRSGLN
jgi:serine/threonine protein kinase